MSISNGDAAKVRGRVDGPEHSWKVHSEGLHRSGHPSHGELKSRSLNDTTTIMVGTERISAIRAQFAPTVRAGENVIENYPLGYSLNPLNTVRLALPARAQTKFLYKKVELIYVPDITLVTPNAHGSFMLGYNADPDAPPPEIGNDGINAMATWGKNVVANRFVDHTRLKLDLDLADATPLYIDSTEENRFDVQGIVYMVLEGGSSSFIVGELGTLYMRYTIELMLPNTPASLNQSLLVCSSVAGVASGANSAAFLQDARYIGSPEIVVALGSSSLNQFMLMSPYGAQSRSAWQVVMDWRLMTAAATSPAPPTLSYAGTGVLEGWQSHPFVETAFISQNMATSGSAFNRWGSNITYPTASNAVGSIIWRFTSNTPVTLAFTAPTTSAGLVQYRLIFTRFDDDLEQRTRPQAAVLTYNQVRNLEAFYGDSIKMVEALKGAINSSLAVDEQSATPISSTDLVMYHALHEAIGSDAPKTRPTGAIQPLFLPLLASAAAWLLTKVGPTIASGILGYGAKKLEEYADGKKETPTVADKKRLRRDRRRREEEEEEEPTA